jgi:AraC family transcriptional regulator
MPTDTHTGETTAARHAARLAHALAHPSANLDRQPGLAALAEVAAFSPFHVHRIWRIWHAAMGETIAETTRRMLLHRAAHGVSPAAYRRAGSSARRRASSASFMTRQAPLPRRSCGPMPASPCQRARRVRA